MVDARTPVRSRAAELQDRQLRARGMNVELYFDTFDIRRALLGVLDYVQHSPTVDVAEFERPRALVAALLDSDFLERFHVLPPHQSELRRHIEMLQEAGERGQSREATAHFLEAVGVMPLIFDDAADPKGQAVVVERVFKALQCVRLRWWERLGRWKAKGRINLVAEPSAIELTRRREFPRVLRAFHAERLKRAAGQSMRGSDGEISRNDFADAVALVGLLELAERFERDRRVVPRFFDSHGMFQEVAEVAGVAHDLQIRDEDGFATPVLVDADYFIYRASFSGESEQDPAVADDHDKLEQVYRRLSSQEDVGGPLATRLERNLELTIESLRQVRFVNDERSLNNFLNAVWVKQHAAHELHDLIDKLRTETAAMRSAAFQEAVRGAIRETRQELDQKVVVYLQHSNFWIQADAGIRKLRERPVRGDDLVPPALRFRLVRFGLSTPAAAKVGQLLGNLLRRELETSDLHLDRSWGELVDLHHIASQQAPGDVVGAEVVSAVMWCADVLPVVIEFLEPYMSEAPDRALAVMFAAACFRRRAKIDEGKKVLERIEHQCSEMRPRRNVAMAPDDQRRFVHLCVGAAYLQFQLWLIERGGWTWRVASAHAVKLGPLARRRIDDAIKYAGDACQALAALAERGPLDDDLQVLAKYALNQRLYYLLELGDEAKLADIHNAYEALHGASRVHWAATYDDTLARYFHFASLWTDDHAEWTRMMRSALDRAADADRDPSGEAIERDFRDWLHQRAARGFDGRLDTRAAVLAAHAL